MGPSPEDGGSLRFPARRTARASASPLVAAHLPLDRAATVPLYRQIYDGLRQAILAGLLRPGQRVPSTRALAGELEVSRFPILAAYDQLLHEGYLTGRTGAGTFVSATLPEDAFRPEAQADSVPEAAIQSTNLGAPRLSHSLGWVEDWEFIHLSLQLTPNTLSSKIRSPVGRGAAGPDPAVPLRPPGGAPG